MSEALVVCAGCYRHVRASERACPFCAAVRDAPPPATRPGALHTAVIAAALALAVSDRASAQQAPSTNPRFGLLHGGAEGYGAPPHPDGIGGVTATAGPVFEFARRPLRTGSRRSRVEAPWTVALSIRADGSWTASGRSGRLTPEQLAELRAAVARTSRVTDPSTPIGPPPTPTIEERVTWGARTATWPRTDMGATPGRDLRHLIELAYRLTHARR